MGKLGTGVHIGEGGQVMGIVGKGFSAEHQGSKAKTKHTLKMLTGVGTV